MARIVLALKTDTRLARAYIAAINLLLHLGWRPSLETAERLGSVVGRLAWFRTVVETEPEDGFRTYRPTRFHVRPADGASS